MEQNDTTPWLTQAPPFEVITPRDQGGVILIVTALGLIFALISLLIRVYLQLSIRRKVSRDDGAVLLAMVLATAQSAAIFVSTHDGLGRTLEDIPVVDRPSLQKASYSADLLYIITIWLTKCSVVFLTLRLSPDKRHNLASYMVIGASTLFAVISFLMISVGGSLSRPWAFIDTGYGAQMSTRWQIISAFDIGTELAILAVAIFLVSGLQLSTSKKSLVVFAFAFRLPVVVAICLRLHYLHFALLSSNPTLLMSLASVSTQIQISYAIITATTPCLRPFMSALNTNYGGTPHIKSTLPTSTSYPTKKSSGKGAGYTMSSFNIKRSRSRGEGLVKEREKREEKERKEKERKEKGNHTKVEKLEPQMRWDKSENRTSVIAVGELGHGLEEGSFDGGSVGSAQMIIQREREWGVEFERGASRGRDGEGGYL